MLTAHQRKHLVALIRDAADIDDVSEKTRVLKEANDLLSERVPWPELRRAADIHDWIEKPEERAANG